MNVADPDAGAYGDGRDRPICVVTVCRNPGKLLASAVESVRALGDPRVLHVIVDGASTDGTVDYLRTLTGPVRWTSEPDSGIYAAMNKGWSAAPEDAYVIFIGADDRLESLPPAQELRRAEERDVGIVYGTTRVGGIPSRSRLDAGIRFRNTLHHQSQLVRKDLSPQPPFDERYRVYADWDFNLRLWKAAQRALEAKTLRAAAAPHGTSWQRPLKESFLVAYRNTGIAAGAVAWGMALVGRLRRPRHGSPGDSR